MRVSTQTACSTGNYSASVYAVTRDKEKAARSMRISLSYLTTREEIDKFIESFGRNLDRLKLKG